MIFAETMTATEARALLDDLKAKAEARGRSWDEAFSREVARIATWRADRRGGEERQRRRARIGSGLARAAGVPMTEAIHEAFWLFSGENASPMEDEEGAIGQAVLYAVIRKASKAEPECPVLAAEARIRVLVDLARRLGVAEDVAGVLVRDGDQPRALLYLHEKRPEPAVSKAEAQVREIIKAPFRSMPRRRAIRLLEQLEASGEELVRTGALYWDLVETVKRFGAERGHLLWRAAQVVEGWSSDLGQRETDACTALEEALVRKLERSDQAHGWTARLSGMEQAIAMVRQLADEVRVGSRLLTVDEAADRARLHRGTVIRAIDEGKLKAKKIGRHWRIAEAWVEAFLTAQDEDSPNARRARRRAAKAS